MMKASTQMTVALRSSTRCFRSTPLLILLKGGTDIRVLKFPSCFQHCRSLVDHNVVLQFLCGYSEAMSEIVMECCSQQVRIQGGAPGARAPPLTLGFEAPKLSIFGPYLIFPQFFFASLRSAYYFFNMLLIHSSNWKIFPASLRSACDFSPRNLSFTHFRLLGVHLSLSCF